MIYDRPMVSVLVLTYNHERYISEALESILMQNVDFRYEILIGDDASTDNTVEILLRYKRKYPDIIKLFLNKINLGATHNAYNILKEARGYYLATCEGDDYWTDKKKLQIQVDFLEKNKNFIGCSHMFTVIDENGVPYKKYINWIKKKENFTLDDFKGIYLPGQPATFVRRNLVYDNLIDLNYLLDTHNMIGDRTLMLLWLLHGNFGFIDRNMSCYRVVKKDNISLTVNLYKKYCEALKDDYLITNKLEKIACHYNNKVNFHEFKQIIFLKALLFSIINMDIQLFYLAKMILKNSNNKMLFTLSLPKIVCGFLFNIMIERGRCYNDKKK